MKARTAITGLLGVLLVGGGVWWASANQPQSAVYTTTTAARGDIVQTYATSGTVARRTSSTLSFDSGGAVTALDVKVGDQVQAGQRLAVVDAAALHVSLLQAQAALAQARAVQDADQAAKDNGGTAAKLPSAAAAGAAASGASGTPSGSSTPAASATPGVATTPAYVVALQASMLKLQTAATTQQTACAPVFALVAKLQALPTSLPTALPSSLPSPSSTASASASASPAPTASASPSPTATSPKPLPTLPVAQATQLAQQVAACTTAMTTMATAEQEAGQAIVTASTAMQAATQAAAAQMQAAQAQMVQAAQAAGQQAAMQAMAQAQASLAAQAQRAYGSQVTDATLASDRARVLQAEQGVQRAQRAVDGATLTSPVAGTVGASTLVAGESATGRSLTVVAPGAVEIPVEVPLSLRGLVSPGLSASVGLVGAAATLKGQVESVSVLPTSSTGTPTYTATIVVDDTGLALPDGSKAEVTLPLRTVTGVVSVPVSAVTKVTDTTATVQVVPDARATSASVVTVATGALGGGRIEITEGLQPGQLVVLADRREPVPGGLAQYQVRSTASATPTR